MADWIVSVWISFNEWFTDPMTTGEFWVYLMIWRIIVHLISKEESGNDQPDTAARG